MGFIYLLLIELLLLFSAGLIFFGGIWGTIAAVFVISLINILHHSLAQFWHWEISIVIGGIIGVACLMLLRKKSDSNQGFSALAGGFIGLVFFGAFMTPVAAVILWILVVGLGLIQNFQTKPQIRIFFPLIFRIILGICGIIFGNYMTL